MAAGHGTRLGAKTPKAFAPLVGRPMLWWAMRTLSECPAVGQLVIVTPSSHLDQAATVASCAAPGIPARVVAGGAERGDSVAAGLAAVPGEVPVVLVHDAARALAPASLFTRVIDAVRAGHPAVVPGMPVTDTVKEVDSGGRVLSTPDRTVLRGIQTPQGFRREVLARAHAAGSAATDDAGLVERLGLPIQVVAGDPMAFKITTPLDLATAEWLLRHDPEVRR